MIAHTNHKERKPVVSTESTNHSTRQKRSRAELIREARGYLTNLTLSLLYSCITQKKVTILTFVRVPPPKRKKLIFA